MNFPSAFPWAAWPLLAAAEQPAAPQPKLVKVADDVARHWAWLNETVIGGNQVWRILGLACALLVSLAAARLLKSVLRAVAHRLETAQRSMLAAGAQAAARSCAYLLLALGLKAGLQFLSIPGYEDTRTRVANVLVAMALGYMVYRLVDVIDVWVYRANQKQPSRFDDMLTTLLRGSLRAAIFVLVLVQVMTLWSERPVASVIAGLGVGGLAIGLAAQDSIKNVFGSLMIFSDRPFELGDDIIVDALRGNVEQVGLRSTRFRTIDGYLITMPNGDLATKSIVNVSKRRTIVKNMNLPLSYDLSPEKVERAVAIVKEILADRKGLPPLAPAIVSISDLTSSAITLAVSYQFMPPIWADFVEFNQWVNLEILRRFRAEEICLAYPTQTIHLQGLPDGAE